MDRYFFSKKCKILKKGNRIIAYNKITGECIKISLECWKIINYIDKGFSMSQIIDALDDKEDQWYIAKLFNVLLKMDLLTDKVEHNEKLQLESIDFMITNRCNLRCAHCCADSSVIEEKDLLSTEDVFDIADKIIEANPRIITITGGEPMLRYDFMELAAYIRRNFQGKVALMTNATLINKRNALELSKCFDNFNISLDGYDEKSCSKIRGKGVFAKVLNSVDLLKSNGVFSKDISLSMVKMSTNLDGVDKFSLLNKTLGTEEIIREFDPIGRGKVNKDILFVKSNVASEIPSCLPRAQSCAAGERKLVINFDGGIYPCLLLRKDKYKIGEILKIGDFKEFVQSRKYRKSIGYSNLKKIMPKFNEKCSKCNVNAFCWYCLEDFDKCVEKGTFCEWCNIQKKELEYIWKVEN
mgnify:FL=1